MPKKTKSSRKMWPEAKPRPGQTRQDAANPQPRPPRGATQRGGKQSADELKHPPMRTGNNGGMLRSGGTNKGGMGATPSALRSRCRTTLSIDKIFRLPRKVILSKRATDKDKLKAWSLLAQFGGLAALAITDGDGNPVELPAFVVRLKEEGKLT